MNVIAHAALCQGIFHRGERHVTNVGYKMKSLSGEQRESWNAGVKHLSLCVCVLKPSPKMNYTVNGPFNTNKPPEFRIQRFHGY